MTLTLRAAAISDVGLGRPNNEDSAHAGPRLAAVADGIGGAPAGELASQITIRALAELEGRAADNDPLAHLRSAVEAANRKIREATTSDDARSGMGTTVTALLLSGERMALLHVGDSRCYLFRGGTLSQLTRDDTLVQALVDRGVLTAEQARTHPQRSLVTQAVHGDGYDAAGTVLRPDPADRFLLCSDGLTDVVSDAAIARTLPSYADPGECAERLVKLALEAGAPDNVTVVIADVTTGLAGDATAVDRTGHGDPADDAATGDVMRGGWATTSDARRQR